MRVDRPSEGGGSGRRRRDVVGAADRPRLSYQPGLDGLRGVAVTAVVLYHGAAVGGIDGLQRWTQGGFLGVSAFFTLSGYLITGLLVRERTATGDISLRRFWARRARRLLPASLGVLAAVLVLAPSLATPSQLASLPREGWAALLEVINWQQIVDGSEYGAFFAGSPSPLQHYWSLAVEEQVYLLLPLVVTLALAGRGARPRRLGVVLGVLATASVVEGIVLAGGTYSSRVYLGTDTRFAEIAIGGLAALVVTSRRARTTREPAATTGWFDLTACVVGGLLVAAWATVDLRDPLLYRGGFALHALAVCVVLAAVTRPRGLSRAALSFPPLVALGRRSYGVYLIHWPVMVWLTPERLGLDPVPALVAQIAAALALAWLSFALLEQPVRRGDRLLAWRRWAVPAGAVAVVAASIVVLPEPDRSQLVALEVASEVVIPTTTAPPAPADTAPGAPATTAPPPPPPQVRLLVAGDSFATSMVTGLQTWALGTGELAVADGTIVGCPFGRGGTWRAIGLVQGAKDDCLRRDESLARTIEEFRPDVVLVAGGMWDVANRRLADGSGWTTIGDPDYDEFLLGELRHFRDLLASHGATVVWATTPHFDPQYNPQMFMGQPPYPEAEPTRVDRFNRLVAEVVAERPDRVRSLDVAGWMVAQPGGEFAENLRIDGVHFTQLSTHHAAAWMAPLLVDIGLGAT